MTSDLHLVLLAERDPGLLPRILAPFARRDLTPDSVMAQRHGNLIRVEITLLDAPSAELHLVAGNLRQIVGIRSLAVGAPAQHQAA